MSTALLHSRRRRLCTLAIALVATVSLLAAASAHAGSVYGGLGSVGSLSAGTEGKPGQINPGGLTPGGAPHSHAFASNPETGEFYIADQLKTVEKEKTVYYARVQAFGAKGEFLAENRVKLNQRAAEFGGEPEPYERIGGLAVDPQEHKVYLLINEQRLENKLAVEKKLVELEKREKTLENEIHSHETKIAKASEPEKKKLEEELTQLKKELAAVPGEEAALENEEEALDPNFEAATALLSFSTEVKEKKLESQKEIVKGSGAKSFESASEAQRVSLLSPAGIAVDPKTHDIIIVGEQNESKSANEAEPEALRGVIQRIHPDGEFGPRYVDSADCFGGSTVAGEPNCTEDEGEAPESPIVTDGGRTYVMSGEEIWEMPDEPEAAKKYTEFGEVAKIAVTPRFLTELESEGFGTGIVLKSVTREEEDGMLAYAPTPGKTSEGTIYQRAEFPTGTHNGVMLYHYVEGAPSQATELGWTGGQEPKSSEVECVVPGEEAKEPQLAPDVSETLLMLSYEAGRVMKFGQGGEGCGGEPKVEQPSFEVVGHKGSKVALKDTVKFTAPIDGARAKTTTWKIENLTSDKTVEVKTTYEIARTTSIQYEFTEPGSYQVSETVATDSLAFQSIVGEPCKLEVLAEPTLQVVAVPKEPKVGEKVAFSAQFKDPLGEVPLAYTAVWSFGEKEELKEEGSSASTTIKLSAEHVYASPGAKEVTLTVTDPDGKKSETLKFTVAKNAAEVKKEQEEREAAEKAQKEAKEREEREATERAAKEREAAERATKEREEREARERREKEQSGVLGYAPPVATIATSSIKVAANGSFTLTISCVAHAGSCSGTILLRSASAVAAAHHKKAIVTLATGSFSVTEATSKSITLHLSSSARALLAHLHSLRGKVTLTAHNPADQSRTSAGTITLVLAKSHKR